MDVIEPQQAPPPSKGGLDAPKVGAPPAAPAPGAGAESAGAGGLEGPLAGKGAPLEAPELSGPTATAPPTPTAAVQKALGPTSPRMTARPRARGREASAAGSVPALAYGALAVAFVAMAALLFSTPSLARFCPVLERVLEGLHGKCAGRRGGSFVMHSARVRRIL